MADAALAFRGVLDRPSVPPLAPAGSLDELERLRKRVSQQAHSLTVLAQAVSALRSGTQALREENRELRLQLQRARGAPAITDGSVPRALERQSDRATLAAPGSELGRRAALVERQLWSPHHRGAS